MAKTHDEQVDELVDLLGCSIAEAEQILVDDKKIQRGEKVNFGLTPEQEKQAVKWGNAKEHKKPMTLNLTKRERKPDLDKQEIIAKLFEVVKDFEKAKIINKEKTIMFMDSKGDIYTLDLGKATKKTYDRKLKELTEGAE